MGDQMLSVCHDAIKAGQSKEFPCPPTQLAAARLERQAAEVVRNGLLPPASASAASALIIAFPGFAGRSAIAIPDGPARWADKRLGDIADASQRRRPAPFPAKPVETAKCFTIADRIALLEWGNEGSGGYVRTVLEEGMPGATLDRSAYVLLYRRDEFFATLGLTRRAGDILVWRCADGTGYGTYPTMAAALADLPPAAEAC